jgi:steroid 5-alpha reductase family enzyme
MLQVFVPCVLPVGSKAHPMQGHAWYRALRMLVMLTLGWPMYLTYNAAGRYYDRYGDVRDDYASPTSPCTHNSLCDRGLMQRSRHP